MGAYHKKIKKQANNLFFVTTKRSQKKLSIKSISYDFKFSFFRCFLTKIGLLLVKLGYVKIGRKVFYREGDVKNFIESRLVHHSTDA